MLLVHFISHNLGKLAPKYNIMTTLFTVISLSYMSCNFRRGSVMTTSSLKVRITGPWLYVQMAFNVFTYLLVTYYSWISTTQNNMNYE